MRWGVKVLLAVSLGFGGCASRSSPELAPSSLEEASALVAEAWNGEELGVFESLMVEERRALSPLLLRHLAPMVDLWRVAEVSPGVFGVLGAETALVVFVLERRDGSGARRRERVVFVSRGGRWWLADY